MRCDEDENVIDEQAKEVIGLIVCFHDFHLHIEFILMLSNSITLLLMLQGNLKNQSSQGEIEISGRDDILKKALNKEEHGGRVRGVGGGSRISTCFGKWATKMDCSELSKAMESCIKAMELEIQEWKKKQQGNVEPSTHNNTTELESNNGESEIPEVN